MGVATTAGAHTGSAGLLHRNHSNPISAVTSLVGSVAGSVLGITNNNSAATNGSATAITAANNNATSPTIRAGNSAGGTALDLLVACKTASACFKPPPMTVNSDTKVANLNADELDGMDSTDLVQGSGKTIHGAMVVPTGQQGVLYSSPELEITFQCSGPSENGRLYFQNKSPAPLHLFTDLGDGTNLFHIKLASTYFTSWVTSPFGEHDSDHIVLSANGDGFLATVHFSTIGTAEGCPTHVQGVLTKNS